MYLCLQGIISQFHHIRFYYVYITGCLVAHIFCEKNNFNVESSNVFFVIKYASYSHDELLENHDYQAWYRHCINVLGSLT